MKYITYLLLLVLAGCSSNPYPSYLIVPAGKSYDVQNSYEVRRGRACPRGKSYDIKNCFELR
jgi:uncharacterized lipoprotein YmbA